MVKSFAGEHNEAALPISKVYHSRWRSYLSIIIENRCYNYSFYVRPRTYWTTLVVTFKFDFCLLFYLLNWNNHKSWKKMLLIRHRVFCTDFVDFLNRSPLSCYLRQPQAVVAAKVFPRQSVLVGKSIPRKIYFNQLTTNKNTHLASIKLS